MRHAGINIGYSHVKVKTDGSFHIYPSVKRQIRPDFGSLGRALTDTQRVRVDDVDYDVGAEAALAGSAESTKVVFAEWASSLTYRVLRQSVLDRLAIEQPGEWSIVVGIPVEQYRDAVYRDTVFRQWSGNYRTPYGPVEVVACKVIPEPMGVVSYYTTEMDAEHEVLRGTVCALECGYYTTDWLLTKRMVIDRDRTGSTPFGVCNVLQRMATDLRRATGIDPDLFELEMAMLGRWTLDLRGDIVDIKALVQDAALACSEELLARLRTAVDVSGASLLLAGGGVHHFGKRIAEAFGRTNRVLVLDKLHDPQHVSAIGYWHAARLQPQPKQPLPNQACVA